MSSELSPDPAYLQLGLVAPPKQIADPAESMTCGIFYGGVDGYVDGHYKVLNIFMDLRLRLRNYLKEQMTGNSKFQDSAEHVQRNQRTFKSLVNTPLKKIMFGIQILSYLLILGSPGIGGIIGKTLDLNPGQTAGAILGVFIAGEILFYGSLAFFGKELLLLMKSSIRQWFHRIRSSLRD